jgi:hypothetical protein
MLVRRFDRDAQHKQGDIIAVEPADHKFSKGELETYLVVPVDGLTEQEARKLTVPYYENDADPYPVAKAGEKQPVPPKMLGKRKYLLPLDKMQELVPGFDPTSLAADGTYQPFVDQKITPLPKTNSTIYDKYQQAYVTTFTTSASAGG